MHLIQYGRTYLEETVDGVNSDDMEGHHESRQNEETFVALGWFCRGNIHVFPVRSINYSCNGRWLLGVVGESTKEDAIAGSRT